MAFCVEYMAAAAALVVEDEEATFHCEKSLSGEAKESVPLQILDDAKVDK